jgi:soluble lytic murein transglycosylase-like protein
VRRADRALIALAAAAAAVCCAAPATADQQADPALGPVLRVAIAESDCEHSADRYDTEVFFTLQEPRLRSYVPATQERLEILREVWCEAHRIVERYKKEQGYSVKLPPELILAVIDTESRFNRYAVSSAGAVGLMQVMPFWPKRLAVENRLFGSIGFNIRMGCEILAYYMQAERNDYRRALARYNGSLGRREYPDLVLTRLSLRWHG